MIVGFDIDYTIANPVKIADKLARKFLRENNLPDTIIKPEKSEYIEKFGVNKFIATKFWKLCGAMVLAQSTPVPFAKEGIDLIRANGSKALFITARGAGEFSQIDAEDITYNWFKKHGIGYDKIICRDETKVENCIKHNVDIFIDDSIEVVKRLSRVGIKTVLIEAPHNVKFKNDLPHGCTYASSFEDAVNIVISKNSFIDEEFSQAR